MDSSTTSPPRSKLSPNQGLGRNPTQSSLQSFDSSSGDSHSSSFNRSEEETSDNAKTSFPSNSTLGRFSFAPATQTTVVTTTTTTTTKLPPFVMQAPLCPRKSDPKFYPLASTPTPESLRDIHFNMDGKSLVFHEPEDAVGAFQEYNEQNEALRTSKGTLRSVFHDSPRANSTISQNHKSSTRYRPTSTLNFRRRPVSPVSIPSSTQISRRTRSSANISSSSLHERRFRKTHLSSSELRHPHSSDSIGLATPETENSGFIVGGKDDQSRRVGSALGKASYNKSRYSDSFGHDTSDATSPIPRGNETNEESLEPPQDDSPLIASPNRSAACSTNRIRQNSPLEQALRSGTKIKSQSENIQGQGLGEPHLTAIDHSASENMSLPSPSLSPIALMNAQQLEASDSVDEQGNDTDSSLDQIPKHTSRFQNNKGILSHRTAGDRGPNGEIPSPSLMDIPVMLNYFESIPDELKSYVMYQMLRRCPKPTLHVVADVVNPALKCDFFSMLPLELGLNIVKYLDVKTMCRAAQVSRKWRHIINSDEKSWKAHFEEDGFVLADGELQRAIEEGWGWQFPIMGEDCERDLRLFSGFKSDSECSSTSSSTLAGTSTDNLLTPLSSNSRRPKRKAPINSCSRKLAKIKEIMGSSSEKMEFKNLSADESPYVAANAAALAVPYPDFGLPSLRNLHLYKSLYQRYYSIHHNWMREDAKPLHLAFRAHDRHVVTCLQFDTDKILTGSDDTNIHVYDTSTGALRATLEGHEGGVWALEYHGNTLVSGSTDRSVRVWNIEDAECTQVFQGHTSTVRCLQILLPAEIGKRRDGTPEMMPKEPLIITGSRDHTLRVWKLPQPGDPKYFQAGPPQDDTGCPYFIRTMSGHSQSVRAIAAHGDTLVSGSYDCTVRVWKISTGESIHRLHGHNYKVYSVVLDHKRNRCISGSMDTMVKIWSLETGSVLYNLEGHTSLVGLLDLNSERLVSAAADSTLRIWDPENGQCKSTLSAHTGAITCFQHDNKKVISGSDRTLKMWNVKTGECLKDLLTDLSGVWQVRFNDRRCVAAVQRDRLTYIEVLDFGAYRDGFASHRLGERIVVNRNGEEINEDTEESADPDGSDG